MNVFAHCAELYTIKTYLSIAKTVASASFLRNFTKKLQKGLDKSKDAVYNCKH